ncbi:hypothetical protein J3R82DRAFT_1691 [Butyriboletus roseoflavus]|nr:hypothetical protein J3R82DRAFT_1691 [Butyriboletus roseoflavus]
MMPGVSDGEIFQNALYVGINLQDILYGVELVLYFWTIHSLLTQQGEHKKSDMFYAIFSTVILLMITIWVFTQAILGEKMWLLDADSPNGRDANRSADFEVWYVDLGTTAIAVTQLMTDALMIHRCRMLWNSYRVIIVPSILWVGTLEVLGILLIWATSTYGGNFFQGVASQLGLAYYTVSVFLTAMLTWMICYRLVRHGRKIKEDLGSEYASPYFAIVALVVESMFPCTLSGIAFLISFGLRSQQSVFFSFVFVMMMVRGLISSLGGVDRQLTALMHVAVYITPNADPPRGNEESMDEGYGQATPLDHPLFSSGGHHVRD